MHPSYQNELKKEFQLERLILFSDAVFAIAITLLVIEIKIPKLDKAITDQALLQALQHLGLPFVGFLMSFFIIGLYWTVHHRMFGFVENYTPGLIWLNLLFLFSIAMIPFSSALYGEYSYNIELLIPYGVYVLNICFTGFLNYRLWKYIGKKENKIAHHQLSEGILQLFKRRSLIVPGFFLFSFLVSCLASVSLVFPVIARWIPIAIPLVLRIVQKKYIKKHSALPAE